MYVSSLILSDNERRKLNMFTKDSIRIIVSFLSRHEAKKTLHYARQLVKVYGYISMADMCDLCGSTASYEETKLGWTVDAMENLKIQKITDNNYIIIMPRYNWHAVDDEPVSLDKNSQFEPIGVTVPSDKLEQTISALFKDPEKIKDRPVFITIM